MAANSQESLATFFNDTLLGEDSDDDIDKIKWVTAFNKIAIKMTKKDIIKVFDYIDSEHLGYIDRFDFMEFCTQQVLNPAIENLKNILIHRIEAFLHMCQIGEDESIEIIFSKYTVHPCKPINKTQHTMAHDPYYNYYYDDHMFHDSKEFAHVELKSCLCCSKCGKQLHLGGYIDAIKHESKCKYNAEKYIAYLLSVVEQDEDLSFLDDQESQTESPDVDVIANNTANEIPPPPPLMSIPPPPPLQEYVIRYNENEMADILSQIPDKVPIWSRLFPSPNSEFMRNRLDALQNHNNNKYIKCTESSAYKDYKDVLQKKLFDLLLSKTRNCNRLSKTVEHTMIRKSSVPIAPMNIHITTRDYAKSVITHKYRKPITTEHNIKLISFKLQNSVTELTNDVPRYQGDLEESDVDDYVTDARTCISDSMFDTDYINIHKMKPLVSISQPVSDTEAVENMNNRLSIPSPPRSKSSFNLIAATHSPTHSNHRLMVPNSNQRLIAGRDEQTVTVDESIDSNSNDSSLSGMDMYEAHKRKLLLALSQVFEEERKSEVSSLSSMTADDNEEKLNVVKMKDVTKRSGYHASVDMGSIDFNDVILNHASTQMTQTNSMSLNPLNERIASPIHSPINLGSESNSTTFKSMVDALSLEVLNDESGNTATYYEDIIHEILEFSDLSSAIYINGYLMLHEMVFDIYNNYYQQIWHRYRLHLWLVLLFDSERIVELERHYKKTQTTNNCEHGRLTYIYNLYDMIYYDQTLFTHLVHSYGIPQCLKSLIWRHLSHNHHIATDLDIFENGFEIRSDIPYIDHVLDKILCDNNDPLQYMLLKSYVLRPSEHHNSHSFDMHKNKKKLLPNLYNPQDRYIFYFEILYPVLLRNIWSKLPNECQNIIITFWSQMQQETQGNTSWLFGVNIDTITPDIDYIMTVYLWDGMNGIALLLTTCILIAIHSQKSIAYFYENPLLLTESHKVRKIYKYLYDYIVNKSDDDNVSTSLIVIKKLLRLT